MPALRERAHAHAVRFVAGRRHTGPVRALRRLARSYSDLDAGFSYDPVASRERRVLEVLAASGPRCVLDVGANVGDWTELVAGLAPAARIDAFEIVPDTATRMATRFAGRDTITVNEIGLDDHDGEVEVRHCPGFSEASSTVARERDMPFELRAARVTTGDRYCAQHGIEHVDLLKIDVEGAEHRVLDGFRGLLASGAVDVVQFEYGRANIASHVLLADFHERFAQLGFDVGKVFPTRVDFRPYDDRYDEDFRGPNFVAVRRARADLRAALADA
jgi:FkbM family methyltransferase